MTNSNIGDEEDASYLTLKTLN